MLSNEKLTATQQRFLEAKLSGRTNADAAKEAGVTPQTATRWSQLPHFQEAYEQARNAVFRDTLDILRDGAKTSLRVCMEVMTDKSINAAIRLRSAQHWLEQAIAIYRTAEVESRLAALEEEIERYRSGQ